MMMSCRGVPENDYLLTQVIYNNPDFEISPDTGPVNVTGHVVDVARNEMGFNILVVQADVVGK
jgi:hypothetical protein